MTAPASSRRTQVRSLWRHPDFMNLWMGQSISMLGSQVTMLALPLTAILLFEASAFEVGALESLQFLPFLLLGLPAGVWVDRLRRKPLLVAADLGRFGVLATIPLAYGLGQLRIEQLYVVGFLVGWVTVFFDLAYGAYLPSLIDRGRLVEGNSKLEMSRSGAQIAGPGLGGLLVQALNAPVAILADAISYLGSVAFLTRIRAGEPDPPAVEDRLRMRRQIADGLRYVLGHPLLRPLAICTGTLNLGSGMNAAVLLVFAVRTLDLSAGKIGGLLALGNVGFLAGAFLAGRVGRALGTGPTLIAAAFLIGAGLVALPFATPESAIPLILAYGVVASFGGVIYNVNGRSLIQTITPDHMLGRTIGTNRFFVWGTTPVGALLGGLLGSRIGLRPTLWVAAALSLTAFLAPLMSPVRSLRVADSVTPEPGAGPTAGRPPELASR